MPSFLPVSSPMLSHSCLSTRTSTMHWPPSSQTQAQVRAAQCALWCINDEIEYATARLSQLKTSSQQLLDFIAEHSSVSDSAEDLSSGWSELQNGDAGHISSSSSRVCSTSSSSSRRNADSLPPPPYESGSTRSRDRSPSLSTPDESSDEQKVRDSRGARAKRCMLRIYGENNIYHKVSFSYRVTVAELAEKMKARMKDTELQDDNDYRLYLVDNGKERPLMDEERPANIIRMRLQKKGYDVTLVYELPDGDSRPCSLKFIYKSTGSRCS
ncbi:hypothetical protein C8J56DRAFT_90978 [Mycena floridula]|nr:hypothetical protein C8J56DRAFT_90978 [Mycena floridula]